MRIINLDPTPGDLEFEHPTADIRDVLKYEDVEEADQASPGMGAALELALGYDKIS